MLVEREARQSSVLCFSPLVFLQKCVENRCICYAHTKIRNVSCERNKAKLSFDIFSCFSPLVFLRVKRVC